MRVAIVSTYAPKACGIAVFSGDLRNGMLAAHPELTIDVVALVDGAGVVPTAPEVLTTVRRDVPDDYRAVAESLSHRGTDVVLLEHEFGLFGGDAGESVVLLAESVRQPLVVTLHTVLSAPSAAQLSVLRRLGARATLTTVFTQTARRMIIEQGVAPAERVRVVPHGAPDLLLAGLRAELPAGRRILSTFGLISAGKGIETAISSLPKIVARHPEVLYLVVGQTHPDVVRHEGESYRAGLERLVGELELSDHVRFVDRFSDIADIARLLAGTDIYLTPYRSREQIVSGALTFAVAAGCPVVSTPYFYAEDLLSSGAGVLVGFDDPDAMSTAVLDLLDDELKLARARAEARRVGAGLAWSRVAIDSLAVLEDARRMPRPGRTPHRDPAWPELRTDHLLRLVDDVGIVEHARGAVPNRSSGYCTDDAARLAVVMLGLLGEGNDAAHERVLAQALAFLWHAWEPTAPGLHNRLSYDRRWADDPHTGDHLGRTVWALGATLAEGFGPELSGPAWWLLGDLAPLLRDSTSPREVAYATLGLAAPAPDLLPDGVGDLLPQLVDRLCDWYRGVRREDWRWFEDLLAYDNARLPQALILAGDRLGRREPVELGLEALDWYVDQCGGRSGPVRLVGHRGRRRDDSGALPALSADGDEQAIDAAALTEALLSAYEVTREERYAEQARAAFDWFLGGNRLGIAVYDERTGGCHDGLGVAALNANQGAESTLAFFQAFLAIRRVGVDRASRGIRSASAG